MFCARQNNTIRQNAIEFKSYLLLSKSDYITFIHFYADDEEYKITYLYKSINNKIHRQMYL